MTTRERYSSVPESFSWDVPMAGDTRFTWEYGDGNERLLALYQKGKDKQWDAVRRIDWSLDLDPDNPLGLPEHTNSILGTRQWDRVKGDRKAVAEMRRHMQAWQFSQFLHGEQGALVCSARIVESVPGMDAKFYAATQTMDEARHVETYSRFLSEKVGLLYPINRDLEALLDDTLSDARWDFPYLGMQVLIEGLALAAFGVLRDLTSDPLTKQVLAYVMQDEARHVAFGRIALKEYYDELSAAERAEREEFVVQACYLMRDRFSAREVWETLGYDVEECLTAVRDSPFMRLFRQVLFSRIVPCVKDIGLFGPAVRQAYSDMGVLEMAGTDLDALMRDDEETADSIDREHAALAGRRSEVEAVIAMGAAG